MPVWIEEIVNPSNDDTVSVDRLAFSYGGAPVLHETVSDIIDGLRP